MFRKTKKAVALAMATLLTVHTAPELVVNAATTGWELVVREQTPLDRVYFDTVDAQTGESYLIGYMDKKVAIVDMEGKLVAKTNYTDVGTTVQFKGKTTLTVEQNGMVGLADLQGREVLACTYQNIRGFSPYEGHTLVGYTKMNDLHFLKIDDTYEIEGAYYGYFKKYNNELVIVVPRVTEDSDYDIYDIYDIYDLTGQKKNSISWEQLQNGNVANSTDDTENVTVKSYCSKQEGKEAYEKAKEEWLLAKESALVSGAESYFSETDMKYSQKDMFTGYQCLDGKMYYFIVGEGELTKKLSDAETNQSVNSNYLAKIQYIQIYDEGQKLISEGQSVLDKSTITESICSEAIPYLVYVLDKEGKLLKFDAATGSMENVFDWKRGSIFCDTYRYNQSLVKQYNKQVYVYNKNCMISYQTNTKLDLSATYRVNAMLSVTGEKCIYFPTNKSIETYDLYNSSVNLFFRSTQDNKTEIYELSTKLEKICTLEESISVFGETGNWTSSSFSSSSGSARNAARCLVNKKTGKIYFIGQGFVIIENCKDYFDSDMEVKGIQSFCNIEKGAFAFRVESVAYDQWGNKITNGDKSKCKIAFIDQQNQKIDWKDMSMEAYNAFGSDHRFVSSDKVRCAIADEKIYYIEFAKSECKEIDFANTMVQKAGTVEGLENIDGELYIKYSVTDEEKYYGYADLAGNIVYDATVLKADAWAPAIKRFGDYTVYGSLLLDKENHVISQHASCYQLMAYDDEKKEYVASDYYIICPDYDYESADAAFGFVFDKKSNKVIFDFKGSTKKYSYGKILGDYILLNDWNNYQNVLCVNKTTGKVEKELSNYYVVEDTKNKRLYAFRSNGKQTEGGNTTVPQASKTPTGTTAPQVTTNSGISPTPEVSTTPAETKAPQPTKAPADTVQKGKSFVVGKQTYKVTDTTEKTVTFTKTSNKGSSETIPAQVKIKGATYKVTAIADKVYQGNKKIKKIVIGSNIKSIGKNVWKDCKNLTTIQIKTKVLTKVGGNAIKGTSKTLKIKVPAGKQKAYQKLWKGKGNDKAKIK